VKLRIVSADRGPRVFDSETGLELTGVVSVTVNPVEYEEIFPPTTTIVLIPESIEMVLEKPEPPMGELKTQSKPQFGILRGISELLKSHDSAPQAKPERAEPGA